MIEGYCLSHGADVPITSDRRCTEDGTLAIPPTWSKAGAPFPWPERPEGYVYKVPAYLLEPPKQQLARPDPLPQHRKPAAKKTVSAALDKKLRPPKPKSGPASAYVTFVCNACRTTVTVKRHGGPRQRFCSDPCRVRGRKPRPTKPKTTIRCCDCGAIAESVRGLRRRRCSDCARKAHGAWSNRQTMQARGMSCASCGVSDRPHKAHGLCAPCWTRQWKKKAVAA